MRRKAITTICSLLLMSLTGCGTPSSNGEKAGEVTENILQRLNEEGSFNWVEDRFAPVTGSNVESIYTVKGCSLWIFANESEVNSANDGGLFEFYNGEVWYGTDSYSPKGVALLTESKDSPCAKVVFQSLNWTTENNIDDSSSKQNMSGKWGSYSWMQDGVGMFLKVESLGRDRYVGTFYSQGQSGGVFEDISIEIKDVGDGMAEVTWPSGNTSVATWGKRDENTSKDVDPDWIGDIWFDCLGEVDFASSRADCNFYLAKN